MRVNLARPVFAAALITVTNLVLIPVQAQVRGVYPVGMSATNSGVTPGPGFTYSKFFILFSRDEEVGPHGEVTASTVTA